jgi:hypothetical protein
MVRDKEHHSDGPSSVGALVAALLVDSVETVFRVSCSVRCLIPRVTSIIVGHSVTFIGLLSLSLPFAVG